MVSWRGSFIDWKFAYIGTKGVFFYVSLVSCCGDAPYVGWNLTGSLVFQGYILSSFKNFTG